MITLLAYFPGVASAAQITDRSVELGSSAPSASTTYDFTFTLPTTGTIIKSVEIKACQEAAGGCTAATGFSGTSATLGGQPTGMGDGTGWTETSTATALRIANATNATTPSGAATVSFASVQNPSTTGTFYLQITTFTSSDWTTGATDTGTIAASTATTVNVTASVNETLTFSIAGSPVTLGTLTTSAAGTDTSTFTVGTNASTGYSVTYAGSTLTSGSDTIDALAANSGSSAGTEQFGINLVANNGTPTVGSDVSGSGTGAAETNYDTANSYRFVSGEAIASASAATAENVFTVSYIANIATNTPAGAYSTDINYVATANF